MMKEKEQITIVGKAMITMTKFQIMIVIQTITERGILMMIKVTIMNMVTIIATRTII